MLIPFLKMHAQGNDFVILDAFSAPADAFTDQELAILAAEVCQLHTGVGADGLVVLSPHEDAGGRMLIFNADGSRAEMCGSALRCCAWILGEKLKLSELIIHTDSGKKTAVITPEGEICVNLGLPKLLQRDLPALGFTGDLIDSGNLHYIVWQAELSNAPHLQQGAALEHFAGFPHPVNVHFARVLSPNAIEIKIWERGVGATLACGTGAVSCVCSALQRNLISGKTTVQMPGGTVCVSPTPEGYLLSGEVCLVFRGEYSWKI